MSDYEPRIDRTQSRKVKHQETEKRKEEPSQGESVSFKKFDAGKPPLSMLPMEGLNETAQVMAFGAAKYGRDNWRTGTDWTRFVDASLRHLHAWNNGEDLDPESKLSHLAHAACCLMFLLTYETKKIGNDDRVDMGK